MKIVYTHGLWKQFKKGQGLVQCCFEWTTSYNQVLAFVKKLGLRLAQAHVDEAFRDS